MKQLLILVFLMSATTAWASDSTIVTISALADVVYSYSFIDPPDHLRAYTTQPSRDREIGLMQGHIAVSASNGMFRGRVALQEGWFTRANYVGADSAWRLVQEARVGIRVTEGLWLDGGIMFSHLGYESMISRDNLNVGRSLTADYTPYYSTGVALAWTVSDQLTLTALVLNGWQQIIDVNSELSLGTRVLWTPQSNVSMNWSTYYGNDQPTGSTSLMRFHNNVYCEVKPTSALTLVALGDLCLQRTATGEDDMQWYVGAISAWSFTEQVRLAARLERYADPDRIFITPVNGTSFNTTGFSANVDVRPSAATLLRCEIRSLLADQNIFPSASGFSDTDTYITFSTSVAF